MKIAVRIMAALLTLIAFGIGSTSVMKGLGGTNAAPLVDNSFRFFAGIWFAFGFGLLYCLIHVEKSTLLLRFLMLAIFMGGIARAIGLMHYSPEKEILRR